MAWLKEAGFSRLLKCPNWEMTAISLPGIAAAICSQSFTGLIASPDPAITRVGQWERSGS